MSAQFTCGDPAMLAGYLYGECSAADREAVDAHLAGCGRCAGELAALGATRAALASWVPPEAALGFRITAADPARDGEGRVLRPQRWWQRPMPAWAQAVAAMAIFAAGAAVGMRGLEPAAPAAAPGVAAVSAQDLAALEGRLRAELRTIRAAAAPADRPAPPEGEAATLQRVRTLVAESEERQQKQLALRLTQMMRDVDAQRRLDLMRIEQTFGQMEGFTRPELANQRQMLNYLIQRTGARLPQ